MEVGLPLGAGDELIECGEEVGGVTEAGHLEECVAVVLESVCDAVEDGLMVGDPMESGIGEDDVILLAVFEGACVFDDKGEVWEDFGGVVFGGKADHVEGVIDAEDESSWEEGFRR